jgi:hypothetical protein
MNILNYSMKHKATSMKDVYEFFIDKEITIITTGGFSLSGTLLAYNGILLKLGVSLGYSNEKEKYDEETFSYVDIVHVVGIQETQRR